MIFVLYPYEITLLSNQGKRGAGVQDVLYPYEITLLSNLNLTVHALQTCCNFI